MALRQGDSYSLQVQIIVDDEPLDTAEVSFVEFMFGTLRKFYGTEMQIINEIETEVTGDVTYITDHFLIPFSQEETFAFDGKTIPYQARVKFISGDVKGTAIKETNLYDSLSQEVL